LSLLAFGLITHVYQLIYVIIILVTLLTSSVHYSLAVYVHLYCNLISFPKEITYIYEITLLSACVCVCVCARARADVILFKL
jgi:uncharacterized Tic20 family protein